MGDPGCRRDGIHPKFQLKHQKIILPDLFFQPFQVFRHQIIVGSRDHKNPVLNTSLFYFQLNMPNTTGTLLTDPHMRYIHPGILQRLTHLLSKCIGSYTTNHRHI